MPRTEPYDPNSALVLSVLLGVLGIDRFYTGHTGRGLGKLFTFGGLGIWWLIDIVLFIGEVRASLRAGRGSAGPGADEQEAQRTPPAPAGTGTAPWARASTMTEVIGEQHHPEAFAHLLRDQPRNGSHTTIDAVAALSIDPGASGEGEAVPVWIDGRHVGHLARQNASRYAPLLADMAERGQHLTLRATIAGRYDRRRGRWTADVSLDLPGPELILPRNALPEQPHELLPAGPAVQLAGQAALQDSLASLTGNDRVPYAATLHESEGAIEVRIDGRMVGALPTAEAEAMRPLLELVTSRGLVPVARATVHGRPHSAAVTVSLTSEMDQQRLARIRDLPHGQDLDEGPDGR